MPERRLVLLGLAAIAAVALFMTANLRGDLWFAMEVRSMRLLALLQVAVSVALSTLVFQTISGNHVLTPSIMGMDALYILIQTSLVFALGGLGYASLDPEAKFGVEVVLMAGLASVLFLPLLRYGNALMLMLLGGIVLGVLFRSLSSLLARLIDPNDFAVVQSVSFADFNTVKPELLVPGLALTLGALIICWRARHRLDIVLLGRPTAIGLGVDWRILAVGLLIMVGTLVAVSTAMVGPVTFLGLIVVALSRWIVGSDRHGPMIIGSSLLSVILLVGGQTLVGSYLGNALPLGVVIEFVGGIVLVLMLFFGRRL